MTSIDELEIRVRTRRALGRHAVDSFVVCEAIESIEELDATSNTELLRRPELGPKALDDIRGAIQEWKGLHSPNAKKWPMAGDMSAADFIQRRLGSIEDRIAGCEGALWRIARAVEALRDYYTPDKDGT